MKNKKQKIILILSIVSIMMIVLTLSGCFDEEKNINIDNNNQITTEIGPNLLFDPSFENMTSGYWDVAGYETDNIIPVYDNNNILQGIIIENTTLRYHNDIRYNGNQSAYIVSEDEFDIVVISNWNQHIYDIPHGKDIELSCWMKSKNAGEVITMIQCWNNYALSLNHLKKSQTSRSYYDKINGTNNWDKYTIKLVDVPYDTKVITVRLGLIGTGEVWFDDAELYTVS
jgi:hypothetical protein